MVNHLVATPTRLRGLFRSWWLALLLYRRLRQFLVSDEAEAAEYAVRKVAIDPSFHPTKHHALKRAEAVQWANHFAAERGIMLAQWKLGFLVEAFVGRRKGLL